MFSKDKVKEIYQSYKGFNEELSKKDFPTGDKELVKFATNLRKKSNIFGKEG